MNLLWLDINASYSHSNLALPLLEAQLQQSLREKCNWKIVSGTVKTPHEKILEEIIEFTPDFIFATAWLFNIEYLVRITDCVPSLCKGCRIILGGPEFLGKNERFLSSHPEISAVFKGDGEEIFPEFISIISEDINSDKWLSLPGFEYIGESGFTGKERVTVKEFSKLRPAEESRFFRYDKPFVQLETSRGCFNKCRFCVSGISDEAVVQLDIESVRKRLDNFISHGVSEIRILDRTFNGNRLRAVELLNLFAGYAGKLKFHLEIHPALLTDDILALLASMPENLLHVEAGMQSLNEEVIEACGRKGRSGKAMEGVRNLVACRKFQIHTDLIAGLPHYTYKNLLSDVETLMNSGVDEIQLETLKLLPGTYFRDNSKTTGLKYASYPPYEIIESESITYKELAKCKVLSKIIEYWYNDSSWRVYFHPLVSGHQGLLAHFTEYLAQGDFLEKLYSYEGKSMILYRFCKEFYPSAVKQIAIGWVSNGLSLKKEPAETVCRWRNGAGIENPCFEPEERENSYCFIDEGSERIWFVFNRHKERVKPVTVLRINTNINLH